MEKNRITLEIPIEDILSPFSDEKARIVETELYNHSTEIEPGVNRIAGETLFEILESYKKPKKSKSPGVHKMTANKNARKRAALAIIKKLITTNGGLSQRQVYIMYVEKAELKNLKPHSYAGFRALYAELRANGKH
jgi:hypothetical protein